MATNNSPVILDGKALAARLRAQMGEEVARAVASGLPAPGLAVILAGDDHASGVYVRNKQKACAEAGIISHPYFLPKDVEMAELLDLIAKLNSDPAIDGILLQLPLPGVLDAAKCIEAISPRKDVDGFHPLNMGRLALGLDGFIPCTPAGVMELLAAYGYSLEGKKAVVVGRSNIVGKPLAMLLSRRESNATVTLCHSRTPDLKKECLEADFLFTAVGKAGAITEDMVKSGCVVVDIGINRSVGGLAGDVAFAQVAPKASAITPVPGGVGPMTIAMLLKNTLLAWKKFNPAVVGNGMA